MNARFPNGQEKRFLAVDAEVRGVGRGLFGYAAIFDSPGKIGDFTEVVRPGAFSATLAEGRDVLALADHDVTRVLARTKVPSGYAPTLRLSQDRRGLRFEIDRLPATSYADDVLELVRTGNVGGCSFCFSTNPGGDSWQRRSRELRSVTLHEISIIAGLPAYSGTSVAARAHVTTNPAAVRLRFLESL